MSTQKGAKAYQIGQNQRMDRDLPPGSDVRKRFDAICQKGADPIALHSLLMCAGFNAMIERRSIWDTIRVPRSQFVNLAAELESLGSRIESYSSIFEMYWRANYAKNVSLPQATRDAAERQLYTYTRGIPRLVRDFAKRVSEAENWITENVGPKRYDTYRGSVLALLRYVRNATGKPHWARLARLLEHFATEHLTYQSKLRLDKEKTKPRLMITPDSLRQIWTRAAKYGFLGDCRKENQTPKTITEI